MEFTEKRHACRVSFDCDAMRELTGKLNRKIMNKSTTDEFDTDTENSGPAAGGGGGGGG